MSEKVKDASEQFNVTCYFDDKKLIKATKATMKEFAPKDKFFRLDYTNIEGEVVPHTLVMAPVVSSNVTHVGVDMRHPDWWAFVLFANGGLYSYELLSQKYLDMMNAESIGKHLNTEVKGKCACSNLLADG